ncbi:MAG TPA: hypothetical protein VLI55_15035 [Bryobacteraceae bacterium]|nr:hypothetical protein [Bryobacteraceae bacterium]
MPELIRLELAADGIAGESGPAANRNGREEKLYAALLTLASLNTFVICGAAAFFWLVFRD